jgi:hypothetical protein
MPGSRLVKVRVIMHSVQELLCLAPASATEDELQTFFGEERWERPHVEGRTIEKDNVMVTEVHVEPVTGGCNPAVDLDLNVSRDGDGKLRSTRHVSTVSNK